jgi:hypothetical protein
VARDDYHCLADELLDRATSYGLAELKQYYQIERTEQLVRDLKRVGDSEKALIAWLGHPISEMTDDEFTMLVDYQQKAEQAMRDKKRPPVLPFRRKPARKR